MNAHIDREQALELAQSVGGFDLSQAAGITAAEVREYFTPAAFVEMFGGEPEDYCGPCLGGFTLDECAEAVIAHLGI